MNADDEEAWAAEQGIPAFTDPPLRQYLLGRDALIQQERKQRSDFAFRESLSPTATKACELVARIRFEEQHTIWNDDREQTLNDEHDETLHPGMMFSHAPAQVAQKTKLWQICRKMPKGALLHCHLEAMIEPDFLLDQMLKVGGMHMSASAPMNSALARANVDVTFQWRETDKAKPVSVWSADHTSDTWVPVEAAIESFPTSDTETFRSWFNSRCAIDPCSHLHAHRGPNEIWKKFQACFAPIIGILHYQPIWSAVMDRMLEKLLEDGVRYADIRAMFTMPFYRTHSMNPEDTPDLQMDITHERIQAFKKSEQGRRFWDARIIWIDFRAADTRTLHEAMKSCIDQKLRHPALIAGYDLVGQEDLGRPLSDLLPEFFWFKKACAEASVDIPFVLHAGETLGDGTETDENLYDAILLGTRRIGHGFSLYKHPLLMDMVKDKKILVESCPISNQVLRLTSSMMTHPLPALLAKGVPVALSSDDPALMGQGESGMTHNFWQALQAFEILGLEGLASLAENSLQYALHEDCSSKQWIKEVSEGGIGQGVRARRLRQWSLEWEMFCKWIVDEYGDDYGGAEEDVGEDVGGDVEQQQREESQKS